jgi:hypothetical protein
VHQWTSQARKMKALSLWESVGRQVLADLANGGRSRFVGNNLRAYAELLRSEMKRRELNYTPIGWPEGNEPRSAKADSAAS